MNPDDRPIQSPDDRPIQSLDAAFVSVDSMITFHQTYCDLTLKSFNNSTIYWPQVMSFQHGGSEKGFLPSQ